MSKRGWTAEDPLVGALVYEESVRQQLPTAFYALRPWRHNRFWVDLREARTLPDATTLSVRARPHPASHASAHACAPLPPEQSPPSRRTRRCTACTTRCSQRWRRASRPLRTMAPTRRVVRAVRLRQVLRVGVATGHLHICVLHEASMCGQ